MTYRDFKNVGSCDHCLDTDAFIVGQDSDGNYCDKCGDNDSWIVATDSNGNICDKCDQMETAKNLAAKNTAANIACMALGFLLCYAVMWGAR